MLALKWIVNEETQEVKLFYRITEGWTDWTKVPEERVPAEEYEIMVSDD